MCIRDRIWRALGVVTIPVLVWAGAQFFTGASQALKHRSANMHTLIAIGTGAGSGARARLPKD